MSFYKEQQSRMMIYAVIVMIIGIGGTLFYLSWKDTRLGFNDTQKGQPVANKYSGQKIDTSVLDNPKFKELETVVVKTMPGQDGNTGTSTPTSTPGQVMTPEQIAAIPKKHSNPFKPFN